MSKQEKVYVDRKDREFNQDKAPIINLINSILKTMEQIQWHLSTPQIDGGSTSKAEYLLGIVQDRVIIAETETQLIEDRELLRRRVSGGKNCYMSAAMFRLMVGRFNQYLLSDLFAEKHGVTFQNKKPKHISCEE